MQTPNENFTFIYKGGVTSIVQATTQGISGRGHRHGFHTESGSMVMNQITLTEDPNYNPPPCYWGYLNMKNFHIKDLPHSI